MSPIQPLTPLTALTTANVSALAPKVTRSLSMTSMQSQGSSSSAYSRSADDMIDRLAAQAAHATFHLWSAGNVRVNGLDLTVPSVDAAGLINAMSNDERFEVVNVVYLDGEEGDDWKICIRRTTFSTPPTTPSLLA